MNISIPEARNQLNEWAEAWGKPELAELASKMFRTQVKPRKSGRISKKITPEVAAKVKIFMANNPDVASMEVAKMFDVNLGRITDILNGKYD